MSPNAMIAMTPLGLVGRWSTRSQEQARRNAMAACTVLAARRLERHEVEEYVARHLARLAESLVDSLVESLEAPDATPVAVGHAG